jgi:catalase (peroxidase I)
VNYIPGKDKIEAGEMFVKQCDDLGMSAEDIEVLIDGDKVLEVALDRYFEDDVFDDEDEDWDE